jgi:hypothetical protein
MLLSEVGASTSAVLSSREIPLIAASELSLVSPCREGLEYFSPSMNDVHVYLPYLFFLNSGDGTSGFFFCFFLAPFDEVRIPCPSRTTPTMLDGNSEQRTDTGDRQMTCQSVYDTEEIQEPLEARGSNDISVRKNDQTHGLWRELAFYI